MNHSTLIRLFYLLSLVIFITGCEEKLPTSHVENSQAIENSLAIETQDFSKYFALSSPTPELIEVWESYDLERARIMYGNRSIDPDYDGRVDTGIFLQKLFEMFPNNQSEGILVLDWERTGTVKLREHDINSEIFQQTLSNMVSLLQLVHHVRPCVLVGYYGLPRRASNGITNWYRRRQEALMPIFESSDILFPSIYNFRVNTDSNRMEELAKVKNTVLYSLEVAKELDKTSLPFIWHRFHGSEPNKPFRLIPVEEFKNELLTAKNTAYEGKEINGIVWWSNDYRTYVREKDSILVSRANEMGGILNLIDHITQNYSQAINEVFDL